MPSTQGGVVEYAAPGDHLTMTAGAAITGGQLVKMSANRTVIPTAGTADGKVLGVALFNAANADAFLTVATDGVWPLTASGAITYGDDIVSAAAGAASTLAVAGGATAADINNARNIVGMAVESINNLAQGRIKIRK